MDYDKQRNMIKNIAKRENTIQQDFACKKFDSKKTMQKSFLVIDVTEEKM